MKESQAEMPQRIQPGLGADCNTQIGHELGQVSFQQAKALLCVHCEGCHDLQYLCLSCV